MFTSFSSNIESIVNAVMENTPARNPKILDIGGAFGKYGLLIREGIASIRSEQGDLSPDISDIIIDNLDIATYFTQFKWLREIYNHCLTADMFDNTEIINLYDIALLIDVVEHFSKEQIQDFLSKIKVPVLISTPKEVYMYEHEHYGFAKHISQWSPEDFGDRIKKDYSTKDSWIFLV